MIQGSGWPGSWRRPMWGCPLGRQFDILQVEDPLFGAGGRRSRFEAVEDGPVALQTQSVVPVAILAPPDQVGAAVEAVAPEPDRRPGGQPRDHRLQQRLLGLEANGARCRLDPPRQWQGLLAKAQRQHQNLMAVLLACFLLGLTLIIVRRIAGTTGFIVRPRRWVVERTLGWLGRWRRLSKD